VDPVTGPDSAGDCSGHPGLAAELRALALAALDRLDPALERIRAEPTGEPAGTDGTCAVCPVCALIAAVRGERPELAVRLAEHAAGLLAVLRTALEEGAGHPGPGGTAGSEPAPAAGRPVQRIPVARS
jgi:hypothetical protein